MIRKIHHPKNLKGVNGKKPIAIADIIPYLPHEDCFFDTRHWICDTADGVLPFALTTRIAGNSQQFLKEYESTSSGDIGENA